MDLAIYVREARDRVLPPPVSPGGMQAGRKRDGDEWKWRTPRPGRTRGELAGNAEKERKRLQGYGRRRERVNG